MNRTADAFSTGLYWKKGTSLPVFTVGVGGGSSCVGVVGLGDGRGDGLLVTGVLGVLGVLGETLGDDMGSFPFPFASPFFFSSFLFQKGMVVVRVPKQKRGGEKEGEEKRRRFGRNTRDPRRKANHALHVFFRALFFLSPD